MIWLLKEWAKRTRHLFLSSPGESSESLLLYCLGITGYNPMMERLKQVENYGFMDVAKSAMSMRLL